VGWKKQSFATDAKPVIGLGKKAPGAEKGLTITKLQGKKKVDINRTDVDFQPKYHRQR